MRYIGIIILLVFCLTLLLLTGCMINTVTPEIASGNLENQTVEEPAIEESATAKVDTTKPVITGSRDPLPNSFGWNNTDVIVSFSCTDTGLVQSGIDINTVAGKIVITEGKDQSVTNTGECIDVAGNVADSVTVSNINIDKTPPVVTITLPKNGKYGLNESVTATWSATDDLSGVEDSKAPKTKTIKINTKSKGKKKITLPAGIAEDEAGNSSEEVTISYEVLEVDITKPVITGSRDPLPNSFGWNNTDVIVSFSCTDTGPVQSGIDINTVAGETLTTEGKDQSVTNTGVCIDAAGNTADPVTVSNINIDKTPPVVTITLPGTGEYVLNQSITASWSATDALSGVISPASGTVSIDTNSVGTKTFTLPAGTAMDKAGNSSLKVTKSYSVIADTEEPVTEEPGTVYPQKWATGDGTEGNPWANNCIVSAYTACPTGGTIFLRAGYYQLAGQLTLTKKINIIGEGINKTIVLTADATGFEIIADYVSIENITVDGDAQTDGTQYLCPIKLSSGCDYALLRDVEAKNAGYYGINIYQVNHCTFQNIYSHDNYRHGLHPASDVTGRNHHNTYRDIYAWNNGADGIDDRGVSVDATEETHNVWDNLQCWDNGQNGINISFQSGTVLSNSSAWGNGRNGYYFTALNNFSVIGCSGNYNGERGIYLKDSDNINFTDVIFKNNANINSYRSGITIRESSNIRFISCQSYDDRATPIQRYGIFLEYENNSELTLSNCKLAPNLHGEIDNPYGVAITVIAEKMLAKF